MSWQNHVSSETRLCHLEAPLDLECGAQLEGVQVAYRTWGRPSTRRDNAVLVCHALTGSADVDRWWDGILGPGRALDPDNDFVVCSNVLGSCYGTTGPATARPGMRLSWGPDFPDVTIRDMVNAQARLLEALGVEGLRLVIGGSMGGMQVLEWAAMYPDRVDSIVAIATSGRHSPWCIGLSEAQRAAIRMDPSWAGGHYDESRPPAEGLAVARMLAMCTYRSAESFRERFGRESAEGAAFTVQTYLQHQGSRLVARFDANSYITLTRAMDNHDLGRDRGTYAEALAAIGTRALVVAIDSDILYPPAEQEELAELMPNAELAKLYSTQGHDAFLIEMEELNKLITEFRSARQGMCRASRERGESSQQHASLARGVDRHEEVALPAALRA
jgi:homoserine O-acetyltransferase/O-succinyltransferase